VHGAYLGHLAVEAAVIFLAAFAEIDALDAGGGQVFERPCHEHCADRKARLVRMVAGELAIELIVMDLADEERAGETLHIEGKDAKPAALGKESIGLAYPGPVIQSLPQKVLPRGAGRRARLRPVRIAGRSTSC
jgi:hypothetical protein